jgi:S-adenosylmethionine:tRNA ribosyltransferase-isomerase
MLTKDFYFELPLELIAQEPSQKRGDDRLLVLEKETGRITHSRMEDLASFIPGGTVMVFNDTRVRKGRVAAFAQKSGGASFEAELLFVLPLDAPLCEDARQQMGLRWKVLCKKAKKFKEGTRLVFVDGRAASVAPNKEFDGTEFRELVFQSEPVGDGWFEKLGHIPLPPYIKRSDTADDDARYQTVYAKETGSIASPTAGLHFTREILSRLEDAGIESAWVTLHVGLGTFLPVRSTRVEDHQMHKEWFSLEKKTADALNAAKKDKRKILAVGTTSLRTLESAYKGGEGFAAQNGATNIFIYPGYSFKAVDALFTNFHTPQSTLLMLACAFAGKENLLRAYNEAVNMRYKFFSYGDAMLIV